MYRRGRTVAERLVRPLFVVEAKVPNQPGVELRDTVVVPEVDVLVFDRTPQALDKDIVENPPVELPPFRGRFTAWDSSRALRWLGFSVGHILLS
jgi:hypothetical protein